jgi:hypothetical protein
MVNLENDLIKIHQESIRREAYLRKALVQSGLVTPPIMDRASSALGETLIRIGTRLKERAYNRLIVEEASVPSYLIML